MDPKSGLHFWVRCAGIMAQNTLKIALAQLNPIVGDVAGNEEKARAARAEAARLGANTSIEICACSSEVWIHCPLPVDPASLTVR